MADYRRLKRISSIALLFFTGACLLTGCAASKGAQPVRPEHGAAAFAGDPSGHNETGVTAVRFGSGNAGDAVVKSDAGTTGQTPAHSRSNNIEVMTISPGPEATGVMNGQPEPAALETAAVRSESGPIETNAKSTGHLAFLDALDPLEPVNRTIYSINTVVDNNVIEPVIRGYRKIVPLYARQRLADFFSNLDDILVMGNCLLQTKGAKGGEVLGRFMINSTVGVLGLWDPATGMGMIKYNEDFGQTLGYYGVKPGPYVVLPLLGPSTVRDAAGTVADALGKIFFVNVLAIDPLTDLTLSTIDGLEFRASMPFSYGDFDSPFEYELVRTLYLDMRALLVRDGAYRDEQRKHK